MSEIKPDTETLGDPIHLAANEKDNEFPFEAWAEAFFKVMYAGN